MSFWIKLIKNPLYEGKLRPSTPGSAAIDLRASIAYGHVSLAPGESRKIETGFAMHLNNDELAGLVLPRSGMARKGLSLTNCVGLIDSDYQGTIQLDIVNNSIETQIIHRGDRIAQLVFMRILPPSRIEFNEVKSFTTQTERGEGGFGSTGIK